MRRIEVEFPFDFDLSVEHRMALDKILTEICAKYKQDHPGRTAWPASFGSKPIFSQADSRFLGKPVDENAPESGEPTFDDSIFSIEIFERASYDH